MKRKSKMMTTLFVLSIGFVMFSAVQAGVVSRISQIRETLAGSAYFNTPASVFSAFAATLKSENSSLVNTAASGATYTVDTTADDASLTACTDAPNDCSLRGAINNANSLAGADTIVFDAAVFSSAQTITIGAADHFDGSPSINSDLTIVGPGADKLTLNTFTGYSLTIFDISGGIVNISGLKLTGGSGEAFYGPLPSGGSGYTRYGGAVCMTGGTVTIADSTLSNNHAQNGGAVSISGGSLIISRSTISNNVLSLYDSGGGIYMSNGSLTVADSTISGNVAGIGGGIYVNSGTVNITNSAVTANIAKPMVMFEPGPEPGSTVYKRVDSYGYGGGIYNGGGTLIVADSTISGNRADCSNDLLTLCGGGGIYNFGNVAPTVANSTITGNSGQRGSGIYMLRGTALNLYNSIVAGNSAANDITGYNLAIGGDYNLVQTAQGATLSGTHNITGQNAKLDSLKNNGGLTQTHALLEGSPAIDAGDPNFNSANMPYDQRGAGFPRVASGRVDIGAFEGYRYQNNLVVNTLEDHDDGGCGTDDCTLREAVKYALSGATVTFSVSGTITLTQGEIVLVKNISIIGPATAPGITISGNNQSRIFSVGSTSGSNTLNLSNLTLKDGNVSGTTTGNGGAISNDGTLTITNSTFTGNKASGNGGAIRNAGTLTVTNSTFFNNSAGSSGGAIRSGGRLLTVTNSTIYGNSAVTRGGGIDINVSANSIPPLSLSNSIVAGNSASANPDIGGAVTSGDYNLVQNGVALPGTHNITGQDPKLTALTTANGGPTATMALGADSPALDAGDPSFDTTNMPYDQRGSGYARKSGSAIDIGAFEVQTANALPDLTIVKSHTGDFNQGDVSKTYSITVTNSGGAASSGVVSVSDSLPGGLTATEISGDGWSCDLASLNCTRSDALAAGASFPAITLTVDVAVDAPSSVTNFASVSGGGETDISNNIAEDQTTINATPVTPTPTPTLTPTPTITPTPTPTITPTPTPTPNTPPNAVNDAYSVNEDATLNTPATGVLSNDTDAENNALTAVLATAPAKAAAFTLNADGSFSYTPNANFNGTDSFTYTASDGSFSSNAATVTITVNSVNDAPVANGGAITTDEDTPSAPFTLTGSDVDGDALTFEIVTAPVKGTYNAATGIYTPNANANGSDSFAFIAKDAGSQSSAATVSITINSVNDAPTATVQSFTTDEDTAKAITLSGSDVDDDALTYSASQPSHGSLSCTGANCNYTPAANYNGSDSFTFKANDGTTDSAAAIISITVNPVNDAPTANAQSVTTDENMPKTVTLSGSDIDGDALTYTIVNGPSHGTFANGVYTPAANYYGSDSFTFNANDGKLDSAAATVSITVNPVNNAPVFASIAPMSQTIDYSDAIAPIAITVSDVDNTAASLVVTPTAALPAGLSLAQTAGTGNWTISGIANVPAGNYTINLKVTDTLGASATTSAVAGNQITITVAKEKAATAYTGDQNIMTASPSVTTATVRLGVHLTEQADGSSGDIAKAKVTFELFKNGNLSGDPDLIVSNVAVDSNGDALTSVNNLTADTYNINVKVDATNAYWMHSSVDIGVLNVTVPSNDQRTGGGGWVADSASSNGKANFGFTVQPGKNSGAAPKGNSTFIFRGTDGFNYLVKGNSWQGGYLQFSAEPGTTIFARSNFKGNCNVQKIDPATGSVVESWGNFNFEVFTRDGDLLNPKASDAYSITVWDRGGAVWHKIGSAAALTSLGGGNITNKAK